MKNSFLRDFVSGSYNSILADCAIVALPARGSGACEGGVDAKGWGFGRDLKETTDFPSFVPAGGFCDPRLFGSGGGGDGFSGAIVGAARSESFGPPLRFCTTYAVDA